MNPETQPVTAAPISYKLFHSSAACMDGILEMLERAERTIDIETFYFLPDAIGRKVLDILLQKARSGVKVRVLVDAMGSWSLSQSLYLDAFQHVGGHLRFFNSFVPFSKSKKTLWFLRNHRRTVVVDGHELFVGSFCIGEPACDWVETGITIRGSEAVMQGQRAFNKTWHKSHHKTFRIGNSSKTSTDAFSYITQAPLQGQRHIYRKLVEKIRTAKKQVTLISPYIVPDRRLARCLRRATNRGLEINIITSEHSDSRIVDLARNTYITRMLEHGISIYFNPQMIHSKVAIFDDENAMIGTFNLDNLSLRYNYECAIFIDDKKCVSELNEGVQEHMLQGAKKLDLQEWKKRSLWTRILEKIVWPIRKVL